MFVCVLCLCVCMVCLGTGLESGGERGLVTLAEGRPAFHMTYRLGHPCHHTHPRRPHRRSCSHRRPFFKAFERERERERERETWVRVLDVYCVADNIFNPVKFPIRVCVCVSVCLCVCVCTCARVCTCVCMHVSYVILTRYRHRARSIVPLKPYTHTRAHTRERPSFALKTLNAERIL